MYMLPTGLGILSDRQIHIVTMLTMTNTQCLKKRHYLDYRVDQANSEMLSTFLPAKLEPYVPVTAGDGNDQTPWNHCTSLAKPAVEPYCNTRQ